MSNPRTFVKLLALAFGVPWLLLIVVNSLRFEKLTPLPYDKDRDGVDGVYPGKGNYYADGADIYAGEGCAQCHTQMIRPSFEGVADGWKKGWGRDQSAQPHDVVRQSRPRDYIGDRVAMLGIDRHGPDLVNVGYRYLDKDGKADRNALHVQLYAPRAVADWSVMPAFRNLYIVRPVEGEGSATALKLPEEFRPKRRGVVLEVVPKPQAEELVDYLLALKRDEPVPGQVVAEAASKK